VGRAHIAPEARWGVNFLIAFIVGAGNLVGALIAPTDRRGPRTRIALVIGLSSTVAAHWIPRDWPVFRTVAAIGLMAGYFRLYAIAMRPESPMVGRVITVVLPVIEPRRLQPIPRAFRADLLVAGVFEVAAAIFLFVCAKTYPRDAIAIRTLVAGTSAYFFVDGTARLFESITRAIGVDVGPLHDAPILARTVGEFWSRRWNRSIHAWLNEFAFRPVAKRLGVAAGVFAAFGASALLHFVPLWVAYDVKSAAAMGAFFLIHGAVVVIEAKLGVARWPRALGHVWTLGIFAITAPLFVLPLLQSLGG
jgi:hypothetical protein